MGGSTEDAMDFADAEVLIAPRRRLRGCIKYA